MSGFLAALQMITMGGAIWNEVQTNILEGKIRALWDQHKVQIETISNLYSQMNKMSFNASLFQQLNASLLQAAKNWSMVAKELNQQSKLVQGINKEFTDVKALRLKMTQSSNTGLILDIVGFSLATFMFWKEVAPKQYESLKNFSKNVGETAVQKIKQAGRSIRSRFYNEKNEFKVQQIPPQKASKKPLQPEAQKQAKMSKKTIALNLLRIGFLAFMIYGFIQGRKHINELRNTLKQDQQYFSDKGKFNTEVQTVIDAVKIFSCDVANLADASRGIIQDLHTLFLTKAFIQGKAVSLYATRANQLTTAKFNLTDAFIEKAHKLSTQVADSDVKIQSLPEKLTAFVKHFAQFYTVSNNQLPPDTIFLNIATELSSITGKDSIVNQDLFQQQQSFFSLTSAVQQSFTKNRGIGSKLKSFPSKSPTQKASIDKNILQECQAYYKQNIIQDQFASLYSRDKAVLANIMMNYCDNFYATDPDGLKIYGIAFADFKGKETYADLLQGKKYFSTTQNVIVHFDDHVKEEEQARRLLLLAKKIAVQKQGELSDVAQTDFNSLPHYYVRFLNLVRVGTQEEAKKPATEPTVTENPQAETVKNLPKIKLLASNGIKFTLRKATYVFMEEIVSGVQTLTKAGVV